MTRFVCSYNYSIEQEININPYAKKDIGIELYSLNIVQNTREMNFAYAKRKMKNKELTRYVIVFTDKLNAESFGRKLETIFEEFWQREILNVIIVFWTNELKCFTYTPFDEITLIPLSINETDPKQLFYDKTRNLNGHEIRLGMLSDTERCEIVETKTQTKFKGLDGLLVSLIMKQMNATFKLIQPLDGANLGEKFPNGSSNGIFALFKYGAIDMSFNARFFRAQDFRDTIEATRTIGRDNLCILVPRAGISLNLDNIFDTFEPPIWILIIVALPIYSLFFYVYYHRAHHGGSGSGGGLSRTFDSFSHIMLRLYGWNLNQPYMTSPNTVLAKLLFGLWIIYSAVITNWYCSNLTTVLMVRPRLPDIATLQQLERSNYHIITQHRYSVLINKFLMESNEHNDLLRRIHSDTNHHIHQRILNKDTAHAYAEKEHIIRYLMLTGHLFEIYSQMKECPVPFINVYAMSYGSPYKGRVDWILSQALDYGIIDLWLDMGLHREKMNQFHQHGHKRSHNTQHGSISISHLQTAFYILLFGCIVSLLVFIGEINMAKRN